MITFIFFYLCSTGLSLDFKEMALLSHSIIIESKLQRIDPILTATIIIKESELNPLALGGHGEIGYMQIHYHGKDSILLWNRNNNIKEGLIRLNGFKISHRGQFLAAYNCGNIIKLKCLKYQNDVLRKYYNAILRSGNALGS